MIYLFHKNRFWNALPFLVMLFSLLLILGLCSCEHEEPGITYVSPELSEHVQEFQAHARSFGKPWRLDGHQVYLADLDGMHGLCEGKDIIIDREYYEKWKGNKWAMEVVIWHELGHCLLGRDHREDCAVDGVKDPCYPRSIMHSSDIDQIIWGEQFRQAYIWELFTYKE